MTEMAAERERHGLARHPTLVNTAVLVFVVIAIACLIAASLIATFVPVAKARRS